VDLSRAEAAARVVSAWIFLLTTAEQPSGHGIEDATRFDYTFGI
jgi:hypothetical protein